MITTVCKLSYSSRTVPPIVQAVQGDTGRTVRFDVTDFTIPAGAEATYFIEKPSGEAVYNAATISGNSILCELTAQSLAEPGENKMQVRVILNDEIVTSFKVCLLVSTFWGIDAIESSTEMNIFDKAVEQATEDFQTNAEQIVEEVIESIPADYTALTEEVDELNERLDDVRAGIFANVDQSKITVSTGGRYINFNGVQGTANWSQLYQFDTEKGKDYYIYSYASSVVPVLYFDGTAYPSSQQPSDYRMGFVIRGNGQKAYVNAVADNKVVVEQPVISEGRYLPYTDSLASAELELADIKNNFSINSRNGYYITAQGVQGTLGAYNLKYFVGETGKVYFIKTQKRHAQSTIPLVYTNGSAYGVGEDSGVFVFAGNNKTIYINTCEDFTFDIKEYMFTNYVNKPMFLDMFNDIVCCGDSLTYGLVYDTETSTRMANSPYPETLGKLTGCNITKLATSGFKASDWWNTYNQNITGSKKLYLIYLGTNGAITDTVDTDCVGDDYTQYAETETGYYGRIIQKIKDTGSSCIIVKIAKGTSAISNPSLIHMAERFNVPIVDNPATGDDSPLSNMYYHYGSTTDYYNTVHMNDLGYAVFANMLLDNIKNLTIAEQYSIMPR